MMKKGGRKCITGREGIKGAHTPKKGKKREGRLLTQVFEEKTPSARRERKHQYQRRENLQKALKGEIYRRRGYILKG